MNYKNIDVSEYDALILDRDGVINVHRPNDYVKEWDEFIFTDGFLEAIREWTIHFKYIFVVTNQRGVGRGIMSEENLIKIHNKMTKVITENGGRIDQIYYCTEISDSHINRKPNIGMGNQIFTDYPEVDWKKTIMIGDSKSDCLFASNIGCDFVYVQDL